MTDQLKLLHLYSGDAGIRVMAALAAVGFGLAVLQREPATVGLLALGWALYLLEEHLIHRFIFHLPAPRKQFWFDLLYRLHYGHHDQDRHRDLLFTPLWFSLPATLATIGIVWLFLPLTDASIVVLAGSGCAYLLFEWLHLTSHARIVKGRLGRHITRRHAKHHYIDYGHWFTVSPGGELVDTALGADPANTPVVPNVRTCGLDPQDPRLVRSRVRFGLDASLANLSTIRTPVVSERTA
jgi:hypothetical protein